MEIDVQGLRIPRQLSHVLRVNGKYLLQSAYIGFHEAECCKFLVALPDGCNQCGERFVRFACAAPYVPFDEAGNWYVCSLEMAGKFRACKCPPNDSQKFGMIPKTANIDVLLAKERQRLLNGYASLAEIDWRYANGVLSADDYEAILGRMPEGDKKDTSAPVGNIGADVNEFIQKQQSEEIVDVPF